MLANAHRLGRALVLAAMACALSACVGPRIEQASGEVSDDRYLDDGDGLEAWVKHTFPAKQPECTSAVFATTMRRCAARESGKVDLSHFWDAMRPLLTKESAAALMGAHRAEFDRCCGDSEAIVDLDIVIACDGSVRDADARVLAGEAEWLAMGCVKDAVRAWQFDLPPENERGIHAVVSCGAGKRRPR